MKNKYRLLTILLSLSLSTTGCAIKSSDSKRVIGYSKVEEETLDKLSNMYFNYNYEDLYLSEEEVSSIINRQNIECTYKYDGNVDNIISTIESNTNSYLKNNKDCYNFFEDSNNKAILKDILLKINEEKSIDEDMHKISSISIVYKDDINSNYIANYDELENTIFVNNAVLKNVETNNEDLLLPYILEHEMYHVRQIACSCNNLNYDSIEYTKYPTFLLEASAESHIMLYDDEFELEDYSYSEERRDESLLLLLGMFNNTNIDTYYKSITDESIKELLNYYNIKEEEKDSFFKIIYSMDARYCRNDLPYEINGDNKVTYQELYDEIGYSYKLNLFKLLINRLVMYTATNNISLEENLITYDIIRSMIIEDTYDMHLDENGKIIKDFDEDTINKVYNLDEIYIEYLSKIYNKTTEEIRSLENTTVKTSVYNINKNITEEVELNKVEENVLTSFPTLKDILKIHGDIYSYLYQESLEDIGKEVYNK